MKILLTGGNGFIGRNIQKAFANRYELFMPTSRELDLTDECAVRDFFIRHEMDVVIHSAVRPGHRNAKDASNQLYINTRMFYNIVRNADYFGKFILLGSGNEYDVRCNLAKVREEYFDQHVPADEGGFSKYIISKYIALNPGKMVDLRIFGVFGPYEDYAIRFISNAICKALHGFPITLRQNRVFDYLWIDDLMPVLDFFINNQSKHAAYNVTPDQSVELLSLAEIVRERSGKNLQVLVGQDGIGLEYSGDNSRLRVEMPDIDFTPIITAIDRLYSWYERNITKIERKLLLVDK